MKQEKGKSAIYVANKNNEELLFDKNVAWEARFSKTISCDRLVEPGRLYLGHFELFWGPKKLVNDLKIDLGKTSWETFFKSNSVPWSQDTSTAEKQYIYISWPG